MQRGQNADWIATGEYGGLSIDVFVNCTRDGFLEAHPEYKDEPYVIVPCSSTVRLREQVFSGQTIQYKDKRGLSTEQQATQEGVVGYWVSEKQNTYLGITAFHVLNWIDFGSREDGLDRLMYCTALQNSEYELQEDNSLKCTGRQGVVPNGLPDIDDQSNNKCQGNDRTEAEQASTSENRDEDEDAFAENFVEPGQAEGADIDIEFNESHHKAHSTEVDGVASATNNGQMKPGKEEKCSFVSTFLIDDSFDVGVVRFTDNVGKLSRAGREPVCPFEWPRILYTLVKEGYDLWDIMLEYEILALEGRKLSIYHNGKTEGGRRRVGNLTTGYPKGDLKDFKGKAQYLSSTAIRVVEVEGEGDPVCLEEELLEEFAERYREAELAATSEDESEDKDESEDEDIDIEFNESHNEDRITVVVVEALVANNSQMEGRSEPQGQPFTTDGDSGCVYVVKVELPNNGGVVDAPIGIHRGVFPEKCSYASSIGESLQRLEKMGSNLWFTIRN